MDSLCCIVICFCLTTKQYWFNAYTNYIYIYINNLHWKRWIMGPYLTHNHIYNLLVKLFQSFITYRCLWFVFCNVAWCWFWCRIWIFFKWWDEVTANTSTTIWNIILIYYHKQTSTNLIINNYDLPMSFFASSYLWMLSRCDREVNSTNDLHI